MCWKGATGEMKRGAEVGLREAVVSGVPRGDAQDARAGLVMRKDEAVGNKKKMQVCLPAT